MILYQVEIQAKEGKYIMKTQYILAENPNKAMDKMLELHEMHPNWRLVIKAICERDEIIPTVDPKIEFNNQ